MLDDKTWITIWTQLLKKFEIDDNEICAINSPVDLRYDFLDGVLYVDDLVYREDPNDTVAKLAMLSNMSKNNVYKEIADKIALYNAIETAGDVLDDAHDNTLDVKGLFEELDENYTALGTIDLFKQEKPNVFSLPHYAYVQVGSRLYKKEKLLVKINTENKTITFLVNWQDPTKELRGKRMSHPKATFYFDELNIVFKNFKHCETWLSIFRKLIQRVELEQQQKPKQILN